MTQLQKKEKLVSLFPEVAVETTYDLPKGLGGLYERDEYIPNGLVTLDARRDYYIQNGYLAEELGHHATSYGEITSYLGRRYNINHARQELRARRYGVKLILPLEKLIECYKKGLWGDIYAMCLYLEIDRSYFKKAIEDYKKQFGTFVEYEGYYITFEPLDIKERD